MSEKTKDSVFFTYKGFPLVRRDDTIYYGNMSDEFVVMLKVLGTKKVGDLNVATKVRVLKMSTDASLDPMKTICKTSEKEGLYEALDLAHVWLSRATA